MRFPIPPTQIELITINPMTGKAVFEPQWLRWFLDVGRLQFIPSYGAFHDTTTQAIAVINTPQQLTFNMIHAQAGVRLDPVTSRIYVDDTGLYEFQYDTQIVSSSASVKDVWVWGRVNGVDLPDSASRITLSGSAAAITNPGILHVPMDAGDYFEFMAAATSTTVSFAAEAATAFAPATPSVMMTVLQISHG